jgi:hypothetical protein
VKKSKEAALLCQPIIPDSSDMQKRAQGCSDFEILYYATRQQIVDARTTTRRL